MLCHVTNAAALAEAGEWLEVEPFLHCCTEVHLAFVLGRWFAGRTGLVVVRFAEGDVDGRVEWVVSEEGMAPFPHVFGRVAMGFVQVSALG